MDYSRQAISRKPSSNSQDMGKMPISYAVSQYNQGPLPPPSHHPNHTLPPTTQASYLPPSYRQEYPLPRSNSSGPSGQLPPSAQLATSNPPATSATPPTSGQLASRYNPNQHYNSPVNHSNYPPAPLLPQPGQALQMSPHQNYTPATTAPSQPYQPRIAPAPIRNSYAPPSASAYIQTAPRPPFYTNGVSHMPAEPQRDQFRQHVVGSQGRRGILPSAPGRATATPTGSPGSSKSSTLPAKDADGKFPCPNCNKTYLHAKHLKRHLLRHTGDRPYMCVLCKDTFSRSDILKRHFQKCSVRRGNPTGASHLSNPAAHLKKSQSAANTAAAKANQNNQAQANTNAAKQQQRSPPPSLGPGQPMMTNGDVQKLVKKEGGQRNSNGVNGSVTNGAFSETPGNMASVANTMHPYSSTFWDPDQVVPTVI